MVFDHAANGAGSPYRARCRRGALRCGWILVAFHLLTPPGQASCPPGQASALSIGMLMLTIHLYARRTAPALAAAAERLARLGVGSPRSLALRPRLRCRAVSLPSSRDPRRDGLSAGFESPPGRPTPGSSLCRVGPLRWPRVTATWLHAEATDDEFAAAREQLSTCSCRARACQFSMPSFPGQPASTRPLKHGQAGRAVSGENR
jgi:hypothetical protein